MSFGFWFACAQAAALLGTASAATAGTAAAIRIFGMGPVSSCPADPLTSAGTPHTSGHAGGRHGAFRACPPRTFGPHTGPKVRARVRELPPSAYIPRHRGVAQPGSAPALGAGGR